MTDTTPLAAARNISVFWRGAAVLRDVSLAVMPHDFVTIVGPNGAGKTTLLKCIAGLLHPQRGKIVRAPNITVGYVPQQFSANPAIPISVRAFMKLRRRANEEDIAQTAQETAVENLLDNPLHTLSGGELQRVLLARALLDSPDLLVLDEPTQNLDISGQLAFYRMLERLYARRRAAVLMVSHDLHLVMASTRRVVCLYHHICCEGAPHLVAEHPEFAALLGGDMAQLTAIYHHTHDHRHDTPHDASFADAPNSPNTNSTAAHNR